MYSVKIDIKDELINKLGTEKIKNYLLKQIEILSAIEIDDEFQDLKHASQSSIQFWENEIDDEVWNDV